MAEFENKGLRKGWVEGRKKVRKEDGTMVISGTRATGKEGGGQLVDACAQFGMASSGW
jgi:hypothetical protein